ncbi:N-terminal nucleophile aminohydrolase [Terfezia boudieri ATCC MYA-4762]|uniref:N-terminal nucleophile aminohydrolase n=1 Tax=Terfezia boudieri ATCC MYA-4762 TaxID=1051890 RepID=A0A3N4LJX8_9PEZI|nr:N-terminal nucleophile aminohydrolase [Terfezia boudieri ATCC MYA-4762]
MAYLHTANIISDFPPSHHHHTSAGPFVQHQITPYTNNGGTILGITGEDFVVLAGDTRHSEGYSINSRTEKKVHRLGKESSLVLATVGFGADALDVVETMKRAVEDYKFHHNKEMSPPAAAQLLMTILYSNRFFPKYAYCILVGIHAGKGVLYSYDVVGSYSKSGERRAAAGAASDLIVPFLDNQVELKNQYVPYAWEEEIPVQPLPMEKVRRLVKDAFTSATERHIQVGDGLQIITVAASGVGWGVSEEMYELKKD